MFSLCSGSARAVVHDISFRVRVCVVCFLLLQKLLASDAKPADS